MLRGDAGRARPEVGASQVVDHEGRLVTVAGRVRVVLAVAPEPIRTGSARVRTARRDPFVAGVPVSGSAHGTVHHWTAEAFVSTRPRHSAVPVTFVSVMTIVR